MPRRLSGIMMMLFAALLALGALRGVYAAPAAGRSDDGLPVRKFQQAAGKLYGLAAHGDRRQSYYALGEIRQWLRQPALRKHGTEEGWAALEEIAQRGEEALEQADGSGDAGLLLAASQIRLAADALAHADSPLWLEYKGIVAEDLRRLSAASASEREGTDGVLAASAALAQLSGHWELLRPAALMGRPAPLVEEVRAMMRSIGRQLTPGDGRGRADGRAAEALAAAWARLFDTGRPEEPVIAPGIPAAVPPVWMYGIVWFISAVLAFTGWRNYRSGQNGVLLYPRKKEPEQKLGVIRK